MGEEKSVMGHLIDCSNEEFAELVGNENMTFLLNLKVMLDNTYNMVRNMKDELIKQANEGIKTKEEVAPLVDSQYVILLRIEDRFRYITELVAKRQSEASFKEENEEEPKE